MGIEIITKGDTVHLRLIPESKVDYAVNDMIDGGKIFAVKRDKDQNPIEEWLLQVMELLNVPNLSARRRQYFSDIYLRGTTAEIAVSRFLGTAKLQDFP